MFSLRIDLTFFFSEYVVSSRLSISSTISAESNRSSLQLPPYPVPEYISIDENDGITFDQASLTNSLPTFSPTETEGANGNHVPAGDGEASASIVITPSTKKPTKEKPSLFKQKSTTSAGTLFDSFDNELIRAYQRLEASLAKSLLETKRPGAMINSIDSQLADIRLMIESENYCTLLEGRARRPQGLANDRMFNSVLNECDTYVMKLIFEQYLNANGIFGNESSKNKSVRFSIGRHRLTTPRDGFRSMKKLTDARILKRKADCCLLMGAVDKAYHDYRRAAEALKSQNDSLWHAGW